MHREKRPWAALTGAEHFIWRGLINIILDWKRLNRSAFFHMNNAGAEWCRLPPFLSLKQTSLKAFSCEGALRWTAKQNKRLFCWKRQSGDKLWTSHYTEVALNHNQTGGRICGGMLEGANSALSMTKWITLNFPRDYNLINTWMCFMF